MFTDADIRNVEQLSAGLSETEILDIYSTSVEELCDVELDRFRRAYKRGRALAKSQAVHSLFGQMNGREGAKAALSYLVRFGDQWPDVSEEFSNSKRELHIKLTP